MKVHATSKGRITIPTALRRKYGIRDGTRILISDLGTAIVLKPMTGIYLKKLQGSLKGKGGLNTLKGERDKDREKER